MKIQNTLSVQQHLFCLQVMVCVASYSADNAGDCCAYICPVRSQTIFR